MIITKNLVYKNHKSSAVPILYRNGLFSDVSMVLTCIQLLILFKLTQSHDALKWLIVHLLIQKPIRMIIRHQDELDNKISYYATKSQM